MTTATILMLLQMAVSLLVSASAPEVTPAVRENAVSIANYAVTLAMDELKRMESLGGVNPSETQTDLSVTQSDLPVVASPTSQATSTSSAPPAPLPTPQLILNPRFTKDPQTSRTSVFGDRWDHQVSLDFADADAVGFSCTNRDNPSEVLRNNRQEKSISMNVPSNGFNWSTTYDCRFNLQKIEGSRDNGKLTNLEIYKDFSFTTPTKPL